MFRLPSRDALPHVLDAAVRIDAAIGGCIQAVEGDHLRIIESTGLAREHLERFENVSAGISTSCAQAYMERRRIVIRDVATDAASAPNREVALRAGYRAVQSTPLIDSEFKMAGVLSTYFAQPHHPAPDSIAKIDRLARIASLLLEIGDLHESIVHADRRLSIPARAISASAAEASGAARRQLPALATATESTVSSLIKQLETVATELRNNLHQARGFSAMRLSTTDL